MASNPPEHSGAWVMHISSDYLFSEYLFIFCWRYPVYWKRIPWFKPCRVHIKRIVKSLLHVLVKGLARNRFNYFSHENKIVVAIYILLLSFDIACQDSAKNGIHPIVSHKQIFRNANMMRTILFPSVDRIQGNSTM